MVEAKSIIWAGFDVGKTSFVAALDEATASERRKVTTLPCREFKRNQDEVKKFFRWAKEEFPAAEVRIVMETLVIIPTLTSINPTTYLHCTYNPIADYRKRVTNFTLS